MTNDTTTLNGALRELGELMATNLEAMGVEDVSADDGLTSLANEILNVEPSISGLELEMAVTLTCNKSVVNVGDEVTFISNLSAMYDDETQTNVDLLGVITGATIIFKDANDNILGQAVTNGNGVATHNLTFVEAGDLIITAYFEGTQNFDSCNSESISLRVINEAVLTLTSNKEIIQNNETAILSSTLIENNVPLEDETVTFNIYNNGLLEETLNGITDANGIATVSYIGVGVGDVDIVADWESIVQSNTLTIEDCIYYDSATSDNSSNYTKTSDLSISHSTDHYILTASTNNQMMELGGDYDNVRYEILMSGTSHFVRGLYYSDAQNEYENNSLYSIYQNNNDYTRIQMANITNGSWSAIKETSYSMTNNTYYKFIIEKIGTSVTLKVETEDGTVIETQTVTKSLNSTHIGTLMYMGTAYVKDLKVKPLLGLSLSANKQVVSYLDSESATLTAKLANGGTPLVGETISFYANDILLGTSITNNNGEATYTYDSGGVGDINVQADWKNTVQSQMLVIEDCYSYDLTNYTSTTLSSLKIPNTPFELTYKSILKSNNSHNTNLNIYGVLSDGTSEVISVIGIGNKEHAGWHLSFVSNGQWEVNYVPNSKPLNIEYIVKYTYNNGLHLLYVDNQLLISTTKIMNNIHDVWVGIGLSEYIKELKVKPL